MKYSGLIFTLIYLLAVSKVCYSQVVADAGKDIAFCSSNWEEASIGGKPSASGGTEPYTYAWSAQYEYAGRTYSASTILVDTAVANPVFKEAFIDSARFYLTVTDSDQAVAIDSVMVRFSQYTVCTGDCFHAISIGDSVKLGHCITGGIPPFHYSWTPEESLSDPASETPWAKPLSNTRYELVYTDSIGCQVIWNCEVSVSQSGIQSDDSGGDYLEIYPNPTSAIVNFSFSHPQYDHSILKIFGVEGKLVKEVTVNDPVLTLDISDLKHGIYLYNWIISDEIVGSGKIVVE